jgi:S-DNA-T family DNA segregation ATPase FtsK/SpoIIIE
MLERRGIISGYEGSKPRQVLVSEADVPRILAHLAEAEGGSGSGGGAASSPPAPDPGDHEVPDDPAQ